MQTVLQEMPELSDLTLILFNNYCLDGISQNHRIKSLNVISFTRIIINFVNLLPDLKYLFLPYSVTCTLELFETINQKLTKLKKLHIEAWSADMKIISLPSVVDFSLFVYQYWQKAQMPFVKLFLDLNRQVQILHLSENMIGKIDLSQYENIKIIKYFAYDKEF